MPNTPNNEFLSKVADRMKLVRQETSRMRDGIWPAAGFSDTELG